MKLNFWKVICLELKLNTSFASRVAILIIRLERLSFFSFIILPFRILILNFMFNTEVPKRVPIGLGLRLPHPYNIIISPKCRIGKYCTVYHSVTLGADDLAKTYGAPFVCSYVFLGAGCNVVGDICLGQNSIVSTGSSLSVSLVKGSFYNKGIIKANNKSLYDFYRRLNNVKIRNRHT